MARWNRFRRYAGNARMYGSRARRWAGRNKGALAGIGAPYVAGIALGMTNYDKQIPVEVKVGLACLPTGITRMIPGGSMLVNFCRGTLIGDIIQAKTGFTLGGGSAGTGSSSSDTSF